MNTEHNVAATLVYLILADPQACISVTYEGECNLQQSRDRAEILGEVHALDMCSLVVRESDARVTDRTSKRRGSFFLVFGNASDGEELIADHTENEYCNGIAEAVNKAHGWPVYED